MTTPHTQSPPIIPSARWRAVAQDLLDQIDIIDAATPWAETEPQWWLEMSEIRRQLIHYRTVQRTPITQ